VFELLETQVRNVWTDGCRPVCLCSFSGRKLTYLHLHSYHFDKRIRTGIKSDLSEF
jgi:hypothetical protein